MKGAFWNCRSVGKKGIVACIKDMMHDYFLDFIGIQETMKKEYKMSFSVSWTPAITISGSGFLLWANQVVSFVALKLIPWM
jgi:hypothetical protein